MAAKKTDLSNNPNYGKIKLYGKTYYIDKKVFKKSMENLIKAVGGHKYIKRELNKNPNSKNKYTYYYKKPKLKPKNKTKAERIEKLRRSKPIVISGNEHKGKYELNAKSAQEWIKNNLRGEYVIKDTKEKIAITRKGAEEVTSHNRYDKIHLKSIASIPYLLENAIYIEEQKNKKEHSKFDSYRYYVVGLKIDGVDYTAKIVIGVKNGKRYYDHRFSRIEKTKLIGLINQSVKDFTPTEGETFSSYVGCKDKKLLSILQVKNKE